jgi:hypothetical protein
MKPGRRFLSLQTSPAVFYAWPSLGAAFQPRRTQPAYTPRRLKPSATVPGRRSAGQRRGPAREERGVCDGAARAAWQGHASAAQGRGSADGVRAPLRRFVVMRRGYLLECVRVDGCFSVWLCVCCTSQTSPRSLMNQSVSKAPNVHPPQAAPTAPWAYARRNMAFKFV